MIKNDLARSVERFHKEFGLSPENQSRHLWLCLLAEELGELTRAVLRDESKVAVEDELGDMVFVMEGFCRLFGCDLNAGIERTIQKNDRKRRTSFSPAKSGKIRATQRHAGGKKQGRN
ncbi:MAG TPA: MazG nucleotide pyrophosphohydrolase domain-containing protein [Candidatus Angelobacter sp.]|nr:MazG nucleotide pyrophosphohydrolase domain-containing protein [Candidatus Angelobacter sp.]